MVTWLVTEVWLPEGLSFQGENLDAGFTLVLVPVLPSLNQGRVGDIALVRLGSTAPSFFLSFFPVLSIYFFNFILLT